MLILLGFVCAMAYTSCTNKNTHLKGTIDGVKDSQIFATSDGERQHVDTIKVKDGKFTFFVIVQRENVYNRNKR